MCEDKCPTCKHYLGGGCCRINLEAECAAGYFEAWEPKDKKDPWNDDQIGVD